MIEEALKKRDWILNENRIQPHDYHKFFNNSRWKLTYNKFSREWALKKENKTFFLGQDAEPEDILEVINDIEIVILNCSK